MSGQPSKITNNTAGIYAADLLSEQKCKCGNTVILTQNESWEGKAWKVEVLNAGVVSSLSAGNRVFTTFNATNISGANKAKIVAGKYVAGSEIMANITAIDTAQLADLLIVVYMDCTQS